MRKSNIVMILIVFMSFVISAYFYPQLPDRVPSHWNVRGEVDAYMPKFMGLFLMPVILVFLFLFFVAIPKIDPLKENIKKFMKYYEGFVVFIVAFMFYVHLLTISWSLGIEFNMNYAIIPPIAIILYFAGILTGKAKRNWFIGIRTPWTLSNDKVWDKTHEKGAKLFKILAVVVLLSLPFPDYMIIIILVPVFLVIGYLFVYSYLEYQKETK